MVVPCSLIRGGIELNKYEVMLIFQPSLTEEQLAVEMSAISEKIVKDEGQVEDIQNMGKKKLTFPIKKQREGFYQLVNFEAKPSLIKVLKNAFRLNEAILRVLVLRKEI